MSNYVNKRARPYGFTLVELAIVIMIIGFLITGITAGKNLIKQAELHSVIIDLTNFQMAFDIFKNKYEAIPGDMNNAYPYFGVACGTDTVGAADSCNGNGDGFVSLQVNNNLPIEDLKFWQHMALAGLIQGNYTGIMEDVRMVAGLNVPASKLTRSGYYANGDSGTYYNRAFERTQITLGSYTDFWGTYSSSLFTPSEAMAIDQKMDDSDPVTGSLMIMRGDEIFNTDGKCMTGNVFSGQAESIILSDTSVSCMLLYFIEFK